MGFTSLWGIGCCPAMRSIRATQAAVASTSLHQPATVDRSACCACPPHATRWSADPGTPDDEAAGITCFRLWPGPCRRAICVACTRNALHAAEPARQQPGSRAATQVGGIRAAECPLWFRESDWRSHSYCTKHTVRHTLCAVKYLLKKIEGGSGWTDPRDLRTFEPMQWKTVLLLAG